MRGLSSASSSCWSPPRPRLPLQPGSSGVFAPAASGSGIPHVEAVLSGERPPAPLVLIPVKFIGGVLAIGAGLALGREGPTVQMGASIAHSLGVLFRRNAHDCRVLLAAGAGAGLATAFNAPMAGAVFVLEELLRRFDTRTTVAALGASAGAIAVSRLMRGDAPDFQFAMQAFPGFGTVPAHLVLGVVVGLLGVAYCRAILLALAASERLSRWPVESRAALVGAAVGLLAWLAPELAGGGDPLTQRALAGTGALAGIAFTVLIRFGLGAVSYAAARQADCLRRCSCSARKRALRSACSARAGSPAWPPIRVRSPWWPPLLFSRLSCARR